MPCSILSAWKHGLTAFAASAVIVATSWATVREGSIHTFLPSPHGNYPNAPLIFDSAGNLYGTTSAGGAANVGTAFELSPTGNGGWTFSQIYVFKGSVHDGAMPSGLTIDQAGNLYGTTYEGGKYNQGTVFELSPTSGGGWTETILYVFKGNVEGNVDGGNPDGGVVFGPSGNLYGVTRYGGSNSDSGTAFELTADSGGGWTETILYDFGAPGTDYEPNTLLYDGSTNFYGTCFSSAGGAGDLFKLYPSNGGWAETILYSFGGGAGEYPLGAIAMDKAGNLYGTTEYGGTGSCGGPAGCGVVWEYSLSKELETTLYEFIGGPTDGGVPVGGVTLDSKGNLWGTTLYGGPLAPACDLEGCGTVFALRKQKDRDEWSEAVYRFAGSQDGANPQATVILDGAGNVYGTTYYGGYKSGSHGYGVVFELKP